MYIQFNIFVAPVLFVLLFINLRIIFFLFFIVLLIITVACFALVLFRNCLRCSLLRMIFFSARGHVSLSFSPSSRSLSVLSTKKKIKSTNSVIFYDF